MAQSYRLTRSRQLLNVVVKHLAMLGLAGKHTYLLTVKGRKSGRLYSTPVTLVEDGGRWLVAPYGEVGWVKNARATGMVTLRRGRRTESLESTRSIRPRRQASFEHTSGASRSRDRSSTRASTPRSMRSRPKRTPPRLSDLRRGLGIQWNSSSILRRAREHARVIAKWGGPRFAALSSGAAPELEPESPKPLP